MKNTKLITVIAASFALFSSAFAGLEYTTTENETGEIVSESYEIRFDGNEIATELTVSSNCQAPAGSVLSVSVSGRTSQEGAEAIAQASIQETGGGYTHIYAESGSSTVAFNPGYGGPYSGGGASGAAQSGVWDYASDSSAALETAATVFYTLYVKADLYGESTSSSFSQYAKANLTINW